MKRSALTAIVVLLLLTIPACATDEPREEAQSTAVDTTTGGPSSAGSCVEQYSTEDLRKRDYAFDGTVKAIDPGAEEDADSITFEVHKWYKGGSGSEATRKAYGFAAVTSTGGVPHKVGDRLLVAGDEDFVWECGFTRAYSASAAAEWEGALGS